MVLCILSIRAKAFMLIDKFTAFKLIDKYCVTRKHGQHGTWIQHETNIVAWKIFKKLTTGMTL